MSSESRANEILSHEIELLHRRIAGYEAVEKGRRLARESYLLEMAEHIDEVFWVLDWQAQKVVYVSPAYERLWGRSVEDLYDCYEEWNDSLHPDDRESAARSLVEVVKTGGSESREYRIVRPDGTIRWVSDRVYAVHDETSVVRRIMGVAKDVTERKTAEQAVRESEACLRAAIESLPFDFFMLGPDERYLMTNSACRAHWGNVIGKHPRDICPEERTLALWQSNNRRALSGETVEGEVVLEPQGRKGYYYNVISPVFDGDEIRGILGVNIDITARKEAEEALQKVNAELESRVERRTAELSVSNARLEAEIEHRRQVEAQLRDSEEKYRTLVESASEAISTVREDGVILFVNGTVAKQFGITPEAMIGKTLWDFFPKPFADEQVARIGEVLRAGKGCTMATTTMVEGHLRWFEATFVPLELGEANAALIVARDVDDLVRARRQLDQYREQMTRAERLASLGTMSAMVAHELTQPLTVVRLSTQNALEAIRSQAALSVAADDLEQCVQEIATIVGIIERFRGFARSSSPKEQSAVKLAEIADRIIRFATETAARARVSVSVHGLDALPCLPAHAKDIEQIFFALLMNAIQAADGKKDHAVAVTGHMLAKGIELSFKDDCGGIGENHAVEIFKPFFTTKSQTGCTGLGLCVVEHILERYGGRITAENRPGEGATFRIFLPVPA